ncbi:MAG: sensor domain-containing diguanylate cyclase [Pseudomonadota bacterium]|nr:sensor domain-containing diguanylate cyclase [Pseudomonadota bacterium]
MTSNILKENQRLRQQMQNLLQQANKNEEKKQRFDKLELRLIGAESFAELFSLLINDYRSIFKLDCISLALTDQKNELQLLIRNVEPPGSNYRELIFLPDPEIIKQLFPTPMGPLLGPYQDQQHHILFPGYSQKPASVALLPLKRREVMIGSLNLGSFLPTRYTDDGHTDFLTHLGSVVSMCLENTLNHERLKRVALTDPLTGIFNRRFFDRRIADEVSRTHRYGQPLTCLFFDLDHFKNINDQLGHQTGDQVLQKIAGIINSHLRRSDIFARYGGEEFVVLLPHTTCSAGREIAERIRKNIAGHNFELPDRKINKITISIGVAALLPEMSGKKGTTGPEQLIKTADQALLQAKENGRNQVVCAGNLTIRT